MQHVPETEVHVDRPGSHPKQREAPRFSAGTRPAQPYGGNAHRALKEIEKARCVADRDVDILDHRFVMPASELEPRARVPAAAVPPHDALVMTRPQAFAAVEAAQDRVLRADVLRAPEPVGVPAPDE